MSALVESQHSDETLSELVRAAQGGDRTAMGELFLRYQHTVLAVGLRRLRDYSEAQELCQEVFLQAMQKLDQLRDANAFGSWIRSIAHRMAINRAVRRAPSLTAEPQTLELVCSDHATPLAMLETRERASELRDGLERLRELDRATLEAFYVRGQSLLEMSDQFSAPVGTIKRRLHVARRRLAKEVEHLVTV